MSGDAEFLFLLLEKRDLNKMKSKLEKQRRKCLILVNISMLCNHSGCDKDGVHLPQTSGFGQWTSGLLILLVLWTSESSENNVKKSRCFKCFSGKLAFSQVFASVKQITFRKRNLQVGNKMS